MNVFARTTHDNSLALDMPGQVAGLLAQHDQYYATMPANSPSLIETAHALRYQVYCLEREFENADEHPNGLEKDSYDGHSAHGVVFHRPTGSAIGTARMILPVSEATDCFPIMTLLRPSGLDLSDYVNVDQCIEISRFAISKEFRRRKADLLAKAVISRADAAREINLAFLSLLQFVVRESLARNIWFWTAVMEPKFLRLLARMGICYTSLGPLVMHHGMRQPCYCYLPDMLEQARRIHPECWEVLTDGGALHDKIVAKMSSGTTLMSFRSSLAAQ